MKKSFSLSLIVVILLLISFQSSQAQNIAYVNSQVIWDTIPAAKRAENMMTELQTVLAQELQSMEVSLGKKITEYQSAAAKGINESQRKVLEISITDAETEYQKRQQSAQYELQAYRKELEDPIESMFRNAVKEVAIDYGLIMIVDMKNALYIDPKLDVTMAVIRKLGI